MLVATDVLNNSSYTPVGDILVMAIIGIFLILIRAAFIKKTREFRIFKHILITLCLAAVADILYHVFLVNVGHVPNYAIYILRFAYHFLLFQEFVLYVRYFEYTLQLTRKGEKIYWYLALAGFVIFCLIDIFGSIFGFGFRITNDFVAVSGVNIFALEYFFFVGIVIFEMLWYRNRVYKPIIGAFVGSEVVALIVMYLQGSHHQQSFTTATFLFPAFCILYLLHANPYDPEMGTLRLDSFEAAISYASQHKHKLIILSLFLHEFDEAGRKYPKEIKDTIRKYIENYFKNATIFQISGGRLILTADMAANPDHEAKTEEILGVFRGQYKTYGHDYKVVILRSFDSITDPDDYISLIQYVENRMFENEIKFVDDTDLDKFFSHKYIVDELVDINEKKDLFDDRVVVFCQPVYNLRTHKFDTAEALMRMRLEKTGMVFPDRFIPIAEKHNSIHQLSLIILAKTCREVKRLLDEGYDVQRISVNFSIMDVRERQFSENVRKIVADSGIPFEKIAIEITESQNERDFSIVKEKISELKASGITFYLDDFGTGYSSFERIMQLPFDIIKFDKSMVSASRQSPKSETMVSYLAHMFTDMNYAVLYEGIEDEADEELCNRMYARYLQGYKYSKPIPIEELTNFFEKK
ncbi:EAL domain-containing protein [Butyrivibrio sp. CB08]|uniref:EAL domain-containing protein n=1 Tax=Butyrivibrio sp. CB08 TaxID=2364879 RepID=UPI000EAA3A23|nr:EAL domain-containing protein [Butyrivibrio sp. CB08]RKM59266.1 EAL domain-containing protein [Butyrivibrio sp. CB08]